MDSYAVKEKQPFGMQYMLKMAAMPEPAEEDATDSGYYDPISQLFLNSDGKPEFAGGGTYRQTTNKTHSSCPPFGTPDYPVDSTDHYADN